MVTRRHALRRRRAAGDTIDRRRGNRDPARTARIILAAREGLTHGAIAAREGISRQRVAAIISRWAAAPASVSAEDPVTAAKAAIARADALARNRTEETS